MKILINCINLLSGSQGAGGAGKYVYHLIDELAKNLDITVRVLVNPNNFSLFNKIKRLEVIPLVDNNAKGIHDNLSWSNIYFCPLNELVPNYIDSRVPIVSTILDLQHESYPNFFRKDSYESRRTGYGYAIARSDAIITISNHEKSLIEKIYGKKEVYVTYLAGYLASEYTDDFLDNVNLSDSEWKIPKEPYIIYPAIPWQHKNHYRLIESIWILKREFPQFKDLKLILTGAQKHILKSSSFQRIISDLKMEDSIEVRGFVSDLELAVLIKKAKFMIFPSLYEGFGIPLVDAMSFGTPALTTSLTSIPEVCSQAVEYLKDPLNSKTICQDIANLLIEEERLRQLSLLGKQQATKYSLENTANATLNVFTKIIKKHSINNSVDFISFRSAPHYINRTTKRLTLLIDYIPIENINELNLNHYYETIKTFYKYNSEICKLVNIFPFDYNSIDPEDKFKFLNIDSISLYSDSSNRSHYLNTLGYIMDSVINTDYVMYLTPMIDFHHLDISQVIATLDAQDYLAGASFTNKVKRPIEKKPLKGTKLIKQFNYWKTRQLEYFTLKIIKNKLQDNENNIATFKFLSDFLAHAHYLEYPVKIKQE